MVNFHSEMMNTYKLILVGCHSDKRGLRKNECFVVKVVEVTAELNKRLEATVRHVTLILWPFDDVNAWLILVH